MSTNALLSRLEKVKSTGHGRWQARCPAHEDRSPSLSIRELEDGRVLVKDFAGCSVEEVLGAVGLTFSDLYPEPRLGDLVQRERRPFNAIDILRCICFEALICATAAGNIAQGVAITDSDRERLCKAAARLQRAVEVANG